MSEAGRGRVKPEEHEYRSRPCFSVAHRHRPVIRCGGILFRWIRSPASDRIIARQGYLLYPSTVVQKYGYVD